jgi:tetrahydromethanopterin S-methyltransferase subunit C
MKIKINWDGLGIITSIACAIHCVVLPLAFTSISLFGVNIVENSLFEWGMIALAFFVGVYSLLHGYKTHHQNKLPLILFSIGFLFLIAKQFWRENEIVFVLPAVVFIILAHVNNFLQSRKSKCSSPHHSH